MTYNSSYNEIACQYKNPINRIKNIISFIISMEASFCGEYMWKSKWGLFKIDLQDSAAGMLKLKK